MSLCFIHKELYTTSDPSVLFGVGKLAADKAPRFCNYLPFASLPGVSSAGAELKGGAGCPGKELSNSQGENVLTLKGSKEHQ